MAETDPRADAAAEAGDSDLDMDLEADLEAELERSQGDGGVGGDEPDADALPEAEDEGEEIDDAELEKELADAGAQEEGDGEEVELERELAEGGVQGQQVVQEGEGEDDDDDIDLERELEAAMEEDTTGAADRQGGAGPHGPGSTAETDEEDAQEFARQQRIMERNRNIMRLLTEEELDRYEAYRRSALQRTKVARLMGQIANQTTREVMNVAMCGVAKMFVGDLVETARLIANDWGDTGPLLPTHIHAAYRLLDQQGVIPHRTNKRGRLQLR